MKSAGQYKSSYSSNTINPRTVWSHPDSGMGHQEWNTVSERLRYYWHEKAWIYIYSFALLVGIYKSTTQSTTLISRYFMSTLPGEPGVRHMHKISTKNSSRASRFIFKYIFNNQIKVWYFRQMTCLTCIDNQISVNGNLNCEYSEVKLSFSFDAYVQVTHFTISRLSNPKF